MCNRIPEEIERAGKIADEMILSADRDELDCRDDKCFLAYSLLRDCEYRVKLTIDAIGDNPK